MVDNSALATAALDHAPDERTEPFFVERGLGGGFDTGDSHGGPPLVVTPKAPDAFWHCQIPGSEPPVDGPLGPVRAVRPGLHAVAQVAAERGRPLRAMRSMACLTRPATALRARSVLSPERRMRPPRPTAALSSATRKSRSIRARSARARSLFASASARSPSSSPSRRRYASRAVRSSTSPRSPAGSGVRADQLAHVDFDRRSSQQVREVA